MNKIIKCSNKKCKDWAGGFINNCEVYFDILKCEESKQRKKRNSECPKCALLLELYKSAKQTNRNYWIMTELFVYLHNGKDICGANCAAQEEKDEQETRRET